jgi:phospholipid/cholesterol/gamma-HCH transport system substrate-binding protein
VHVVRRRNNARAGLVGLAVVVLLVALAMNAGRLPLIGTGGRELHARFTDTSGLEVGDRVEVAGVRVGRVEGLEMGRGYITVSFTVDETLRLGEDTRARIKVSNLLGSKYLELEPSGGGSVADPIPVESTRPAYDVTAAFGDLTETLDPIDTGQLEDALDAITSTLRGSGGDVRATLRGLSTLSRAVASRDQQVARLLDHSEQLTGTLDGSRRDLAALARDASRLLAEVDRRRVAVHGLIVHTRELSEQLRGLVSDNEAQIGPALRELGEVTGQLEARQARLRATMREVTKFARVFVNTVGGGPWFDSYIANAPNSLELEDPK